jgi:preprotein translocase subunit SecD
MKNGDGRTAAAGGGQASVTRTRYGQWIVDYTTTAAGAPLWDRVAQGSFHGFLGIELDGVVYSAPIIRPPQRSFSSFVGRGEISGELSKAAAIRLAKALSAHKG